MEMNEMTVWLIALAGAIIGGTIGYSQGRKISTSAKDIAVDVGGVALIGVIVSVVGTAWILALIEVLSHL